MNPSSRLFKIAKIVVLGVLIVSVFPLANIAQAQDTIKPDANTLVVAQSVDITTLEPDNINSRAEANIANHLFGTLYEVTDKGEIIPYLAKSADYTADGKGMTFVLNDGLTCQDGSPLTADDVVYSFQ